jgi:uncharacterized membrane protein
MRATMATVLPCCRCARHVEDFRMSWLVTVTEYTLVVIDSFALLTVIIGTVEAFVATMRSLFRPAVGDTRWRAFAHYGRWLVAGLTFQLAADILESSITTTWQAVARLAAVAAIRTFLNYFLERDFTELEERRRAGSAAVPAIELPRPVGADPRP